MSRISIKQFNSTGSRLISRFRKNLSETVKIETDFGKGNTTITTQFDTDGALLKRIIEKRHPRKPTEKTIITYNGIYGVRRKTVIEKFINKKRAQKIVKSEVLQNIKGRNFLTRVVSIFTPLKNNLRHESQIIEELSTNKHRRYIKTTAIKIHDGELVEKTIEGNVKHLKKFAKSPYFYFIGYSPKEFLKAIFYYAKKLQKVSKREIHLQFGTTPKCAAATSQSSEGTGLITFNPAEADRISLSGQVNLLNHELRHQYQDATIEKFAQKGLRGFLLRIFHPIQYEHAKRWENELINYISAAKDKEKYLNQFVERDARLAGGNAREEFLKETRILSMDLFPYSYELFTASEEAFRLLTHVNKSR